MSLQVRILLALVTTSVMGVGLLGAYGLYVSRQSVEDRIVRALVAENQVAIYHAESVLRGMFRDVQLLRSDFVLQSLLAAPAEETAAAERETWRVRLAKECNRIMQLNPLYVDVRYLDESGQEVVSVERRGTTVEIVPKSELHSDATCDWFQRAVGLGRQSVYVSPLEINREQGEIVVPHARVIRMAMPVFNANRRCRGVVSLKVNAEELLKRIESEQPGLVAGFVVESSGDRVQHASGDETGKAAASAGALAQTDSAAALRRDYPQIAERALSGQSGYLDVGEHVLFYHPLSAPGEPRRFWVVMRLFSKKMIYAPVYLWQVVGTAVMAVVLVFAVMVSIPLSARLTQPLHQLLEAARALKAGNLAHRVEVGPRDEIGTLAEAFNEMAAQLESSQRQLRQRMAEVEAAEQRFRGLLESAPDGIVALDSRGRLRLASSQAEVMFGYPRTELQGQSIGRLLPGVPESRFLQPLQQRPDRETGAKGGPDLEALGRRKDGQWFPVEVGLSPMQSGRESMVVCVIRDVSERKRTQQELERRHRELTLLHEVGLAVSSTLDVSQILQTLAERVLRLAEVDRVSIALREASTDEVSFYASQTVQPHDEADRRSHATRSQAAPPMPTAPTEALELERLTADWIFGSRKSLVVPDVHADARFVAAATEGEAGLVSYLGLPLLSKGQPLGVLGLSTRSAREFADRDISFLESLCGTVAVALENARIYGEIEDRAQRLARQIAVQEQYAENVLQSIVDGVFTVDTEDRIVSWNPGAEVITGYAEAEVLGKPRIDVIRSVDETGTVLVEPEEDRLQLVDEESDPFARREAVALHAGGHSIPLSITRAPLLDEEGRFVGAVEVFRDISRERELMERIQSAAQAKSDFLASMSHELRTPLNAIIGFAQLLRNPRVGPLNDRQTEYLQDITDSGEHLLALINDILDLSKVEAGKLELELSEFSLTELLNNSLIMVKERALRHALNVTVNVADDVPPIQGDERKVKQIIVNLLSNAVKFTPDRGSVGIEAVRRDDMVEVSVWDTGVGIAHEDHSRIFDPFDQVRTQRTHKTQGTGLGLALTRRLVALHGGTIWVESELQQGSRFTFSLPLRQAPPGPEAEESSSAAV